MLSILLAFTTTQSAFASAPECPWMDADNVTVRADMTNVYINDVAYGVRSSDARASFAALLKSCGADDATQSLEKWRAKRRRINIAGASTAGASVVPIVGWIAFFPLGIWAIVELAGVAGVRDQATRTIDASIETGVENIKPAKKGKK